MINSSRTPTNWLPYFFVGVAADRRYRHVELVQIGFGFGDEPEAAALQRCSELQL